MSAVVHDADPIWIAADAQDAARLPPEARRILPLMPVARAALAGTDRAILDPRRHFGDWAQARTVAAVRRARLKLEAAVSAGAVAAMAGADAGPPNAGNVEREIALDHFLRAAYTGYRLWFTLGAEGPWMVPETTGWRRADTRGDAYSALLRHMLAPLVAGQAKVAAVRLPPLPGLYRRLRDTLLRAACRKRPAFVSGARKGMFGLLDAIAAEPGRPRIVVVQPADGGWRDYLRLARAAWRAAKGDRFLDVSLLAAPRGELRAAADRLVAAVEDRVIAEAFAHYRDLLAYRLAQAAPAHADARAVVSATAPRHYLSADASRISDWALADACGEQGATRWVLSRNTHVPPYSRLAEEGSRNYFLERQPEGLVDRYLFWSPHGAAAARSFLPRDRWDRIEPIRAVGVTAANAARHTGKRILAADSFASFWYTHYWVYQTSDEFLDAHLALAQIVESLPDVSLTIRLKSKKELGPADYARLLPRSDKVTVKSRGGPLMEDVLGADLVVAFRSTTIEEAIHARRPVFLWGSTDRYRYLPARTAPPRPGDRSAVYAANSGAELGPMLRAILDCHAGRPLTDAEIAGHVWPESVPRVEDVARRLLGRADAPAVAPARRGVADALSEKGGRRA